MSFFFVVQVGIILDIMNLFVVLKALQVLVDQSKKANSPLKGHERTVQYLQHLGECEGDHCFCEGVTLVGLKGYSTVLQLSRDCQAKGYPCHLV